MSLFQNLATDDSIQDEKDVLGGGGFKALPSNIYDFTIKLAYVTIAASKATGIVLELETEAGEKLKVTEWVSSGEAKGCKNYYEKDGQKYYLPGFNNINAVCLLTVGKELKDMETETKQIPLWNSEAKAEVPTKTQVLTDLHGQAITMGVLREIHNKTKWNAETKEREVVEGTVEQYVINKVFRTKDHKTVAEIRGQAEEATFYSQWKEKNEGKDVDKTKATPAGAGTAGAPKSAAAGNKPKTSLFG